MRTLTAKQQRFIAEYLKDLNATSAARRAGYHPKMAAKLVAKSSIQAEVAKIQENQLQDANLTAVITKRVIGWQLRRDLRQLYDDQGNLKPIQSLTEEQQSWIAGMDVVKRNLTSGDGKQDVILKLKLEDRGRYVEMAAKHFGLLTEKIEHSGGIDIKWQE